MQSDQGILDFVGDVQVCGEEVSDRIEQIGSEYVSGVSDQFDLDESLAKRLSRTMV